MASETLRAAIKAEVKRQMEGHAKEASTDPAGTTNFDHAPTGSQFVTPTDRQGPGYMRGRWRKIKPKKWTSPGGVSLTVNAERVSGGFPEHQFVYFNGYDTVQVVG